MTPPALAANLERKDLSTNRKPTRERDGRQTDRQYTTVYATHGLAGWRDGEEGRGERDRGGGRGAWVECSAVAYLLLPTTDLFFGLID